MASYPGTLRTQVNCQTFSLFKGVQNICTRGTAKTTTGRSRCQGHPVPDMPIPSQSRLMLDASIPSQSRPIRRTQETQTPPLTGLTLATSTPPQSRSPIQHAATAAAAHSHTADAVMASQRTLNTVDACQKQVSRRAANWRNSLPGCSDPHSVCLQSNLCPHPAHSPQRRGNRSRGLGSNRHGSGPPSLPEACGQRLVDSLRGCRHARGKPQLDTVCMFDPGHVNCGTCIESSTAYRPSESITLSGQRPCRVCVAPGWKCLRGGHAVTSSS